MEGFTSAVKEAKEVQAKIAALKKKAAEGDKDAKRNLFSLQLDLMHLTAKQARETFINLKLNIWHKADLAPKVMTLEVKEIMAGVTRDKDTQIAAGEKFAAMYKEVGIPSDSSTHVNFLSLIMLYAESEKNVELFERALDSFREKYGNNPRYARFIRGQRGKLENMKK